jgi:methionine-rich copper-binding protein CopC
MKRRRFLSATAALIFAAAAVGESVAHAFLERANPPVGGTVSAPAEIRLWFSEPLEPRFLRMQLANAAGQRIATGQAAIVGGNQLVVRVPRLGPGIYRVSWKIVSVDTHKTEGSFTFEVIR